MATFKKTKWGWQAQVAIGGVRKAKTLPFKSDAVAWAREQESNITGTDTVQEAIEKYIEEECPKHKGARWEIIRLKRIAPELPEVRLCDLTPNDLAGWRNKRLKQVAAPSVKRELSLLNQVFNVALREWGWLKTNPLLLVSKPADSKPRRRGVSQEEILGVTAELGYSTTYEVKTKRQEVAVAFLFAIETAMRLGEILSLLAENVDLASGVVTLVDTKNGDRREVPLTIEAIRLLKQLPSINNSEGKLFTVESGSASSLFRKAKNNAGFHDLHFHDSRSEGLTRLSRILSVIELARVVGHRSPASLMIYYSPSMQQIAAQLHKQQNQV